MNANVESISRINDNDNAEHTCSRINDNDHVPALMTTIMRHKLINECTRPTQHIINVKKKYKRDCKHCVKHIKYNYFIFFLRH